MPSGMDVAEHVNEHTACADVCLSAQDTLIGWLDELLVVLRAPPHRLLDIPYGTV